MIQLPGVTAWDILLPMLASPFTFIIVSSVVQYAHLVVQLLYLLRLVHDLRREHLAQSSDVPHRPLCMRHLRRSHIVMNTKNPDFLERFSYDLSIYPIVGSNPQED